MSMLIFERYRKEEQSILYTSGLKNELKWDASLHLERREQYMPSRLVKVVSGLDKFKASLVVFISFFILGIYIVSTLNNAEKEADTAHTLQVANGYASAVEKVIQHALSATHTLAVMVHQGNGQVQGYTDLVHYMMPMYKGAYALSLAPDGVMRQIEPAIQNRSVLNHDLFEHKDRAKEIAQIREGELKFVGPFQLLQGPQGAIGMLPVFLQRPSGEKYFWGYTLVSLKFPDAFEDVHLENLEKEGYAYSLTGLHRFENKQVVMQQSQLPLGEDAVHVPIQIHGVDWILNVSKTGEPTSFKRLFFEYVLVFFAALLMGWLAYALIKLAEQSAQLKAIAMIDPLTELPNRRMLSSKLGGLILKSKTNEVVVCYLDLDGFKAVNDRLGHAVGDQLLKLVAARLKACVREHDVIARVGGDEFIVVLSKLTSVKEAETVITRIIQAIDQPFAVSQEKVEVTVSIGAAIYDVDGEEADQLLRASDQAMYIAKHSGKNRYFFAEH